MKSGRPSAHPVWEKCTCASINPGVTNIPFASMVCTPSGTSQLPAQSILPSRMMMLAFAIGAPPRPSMSVAPAIARGAGGVPGGVSTAPVTAIFQPLCSSAP